VIQSDFEDDIMPEAEKKDTPYKECNESEEDELLK